MTIEEEYGLAVLQEAQAICVAKHVKVRPNEFVLPARTGFNLSDANSGFEAVDDPAVKVFDDTTPLDVLS